MPRQIEGSKAVAETIARCRPEVIAAYPISRRPTSSRRSRRWWSGRAVALRVHQRGVGVRRHVGGDRRVGDGRARLHRDRQPGAAVHGEALYNASGLGLPIVMTVANRAIGAPINIWNDHSDSDVPARLRLDPALRRVQPGGDRPAHPGVPARRRARPPGHGVHGRLRAHPRPRAPRGADRPRSPRSCRRSARARCSIPRADHIGAMVGPEAFMEVRYLMTPSSASRSTRSRVSPATSRGIRARLRGPRARLPARGRRDGRRRARLRARRDRGRRGQAARPR